MYYIQRDSDGRVIRLEDAPFAEMTGELDPNFAEAEEWYRHQLAAAAGLEQLRQSDLDMVRVLEDLIQVLMQKGLVNITDFPTAAQVKLISRTQAREALNGGLNKLIGDDEESMF